MLHVHHADRADLLVEALAGVLAVPPADPFDREVVAVHARGIERWLAQRLSHHLGARPGHVDGVAADLDFPFPGRLVGEVVAHATGHDPARDPWRADRLVWPLLDVVTEAAAAGDGATLGPLRSHVVDGDGHTRDRRLGAVRRVAELFAHYAIHRPAMIRAWATDLDAEDDGRVDVGADGAPLADRSRWQPRLWRAVRRRLDRPSGPEVLGPATAAIAAGVDADGRALELDLPDRLAVFGITALSATTLEVLAALAAGPTPTAPDGRDVHLLLLHPSPVLWRRTARHLDVGVDGVAGTLPPRDADPTATLARAPLLASWGRDTRELQLVVHTVPATHHDLAPDDPAPAAPDAPLLHRLQDQVTGDRAPVDGADLPVLAADDRSVQLHRCHGPARQVEVLRDLLLHLLAASPDLEPRDVIVLCPDIETFAPLVRAVFGTDAVRAAAGADVPGGELRVQLADRAVRRTNPLLRVLAELLDLADGRVTGSAVLDLCTRAPVRRRFDLDEDDLGRLDAWLEATGVRWGFDAEHRSTHGIATDANTWRTGLDRLLTGVAVADEGLRTVLGVAPEDDVEGDAADLAGRLAELLARLTTVVATLRRPRPVGAWLDALAEAVALLGEPDPDAPWQQAGFDRALADVRDAVAGTSPDAAHLAVSLAEVRDLLGERLDGAPSRAAHRTGDLTVCTLVPMRSVPHEVVVLLGMDDEVFPRRTVPDGDDLLAAAPLVGDRDPRTEDRQLLLDALLAARRQLVVVTTGHDPRTGEPRPPAVPVGELLETVDRTVAAIGPDGGPTPASEAITVDHPLQAFDPRRFVPAGQVGPDTGSAARWAGGPVGFDPVDLDAARAVAGVRTDPPPFLAGRLAPPDVHGPLLLSDLVAFLQHPIQAFLVQRLDVRYPRDGDRRSDAVPVELGGLAQWGIGDRLLQRTVEGHDPDRWLEVEVARHTLPPGDLRDVAVAEARATVDEVVRLAAAQGVHLDRVPDAVTIDVPLPDGRRVVGSVGVVGDTRRAVSYSRLSRRSRLTAWVELLALTAAHPDRPWRAVTLGRGRPGTKGPDGDKAVASLSTLAPGPDRELRAGATTRVVPNPLGPADAPPDERRRRATDALATLVDLRDRGLCGPLLLPCATAGAHAEVAWDVATRGRKASPLVAARGEWDTGSSPFPREDRDGAHRTVLGELTADELLAVVPEPDEHGPGWDADEPSRLGRLGRRVWWPLLVAEEVVDR